METTNEAAKWIQLGREHWRRLKGNRSYVETPDVETGIGALAVAWHEQGGSFANHQPNDAETFDKFLLKVSDGIPSFLHDRNRSPERMH